MKYKVLGIGEILWDLLPSGKQLGGATANFAYHAHALGAEARPISRVGDDPLGREILDRLGTLGLPADGVTVDPTAPTGTVSVEIQPDGQPRFIIHENVAWDRLEAIENVQADAICFGSLGQRGAAARRAIRAMVAAAPENALRVVDINLRRQFYSREIIESSLALSDALKLNETELPVLAEMFGLGGDPRTNLLRWLGGSSFAPLHSRAAQRQPLAGRRRMVGASWTMRDGGRRRRRRRRLHGGLDAGAVGPATVGRHQPPRQ